MDLSPPADWREATISLSKAPSGTTEGCITIADPDAPDGFRTFRVTNWRGEKHADVTVIQCHITIRGRDPWLDGWMERLATRIQGG